MAAAVWASILAVLALGSTGAVRVHPLGRLAGIVLLAVIPLSLALAVYTSRRARESVLAAARLVVGFSGGEPRLAAGTTRGTVVAHYSRTAEGPRSMLRFEPSNTLEDAGSGGLLVGDKDVIIGAPAFRVEDPCCRGAIIAYIVPGRGHASAEDCDSRGCARASLEAWPGQARFTLDPGGGSLLYLCASPRGSGFMQVCRRLASSTSERASGVLPGLGKPLVLVMHPRSARELARASRSLPVLACGSLLEYTLLLVRQGRTSRGRCITG